MIDLPTPAAWTEGAACAQYPPDMFFPDKGRADEALAAKRVCATCPVAALCLEEALTSTEALLGIWGGTTERERRPLRNARGTTRYERTHCRNNHAYTAKNTRVTEKGQRQCLKCAAAAERRKRDKKGAAA